MTGSISIFLAFVAGLLSFLSPCVLPLIPSWLCFLGGGVVPSAVPIEKRAEAAATAGAVAAGAVTGGVPSAVPAAKPRFVPVTISFILGFSAVFVALSLLLSGTLLLMGGLSRIITAAAGIIVILLGLNMLFNFLGFLNYEKRFHLTRRPRGLAGGFLAGAAFGAGWTPCVGPILGSILLLAGQSGGMGGAALCLTAYSAGLGIPFLAAAAFFDRFLMHAAGLRRRLPLIQRISGILLIIIGLLILSGRYQALNIFLMKSEYAFTRWAGEGGPWVRFAPALLYFLAAALPPALRLVRKKPLRSRPLVICSGIFAILAVIQAAGFLDTAGLLARWFVYRL